ncbi:MAG: hypothetical protein CBE27_001650 [Pelagibacteraceae bacterium TMED267]|jgi:uncharacterized protein (TIGR02001 family)|nr:MAG: hypothetical protein CBE27_001650 [Pelagibacteraceae bacterium TMED267]
MNKLKLTLIGLALVFVSTFTNAISVSGNAAIQTDYIWRGMTQNDGQNSVNVGLDVDFENGFYVGTWGAAVDVGASTLELDYYGGYTFEMGGIGVNIGAIQVKYDQNNDADFSENYIALSLPMNVGLHFSEGDELGDYTEISWGMDLETGSISLAYGDMDSSSGSMAANTADGGSHTTIGYSIPAGNFTVDLSYSDFHGDTNANGTTNNQDAVVLTISM